MFCTHVFWGQHRVAFAAVKKGLRNTNDTPSRFFFFLLVRARTLCVVFVSSRLVWFCFRLFDFYLNLTNDWFLIVFRRLEVGNVVIIRLLPSAG